MCATATADFAVLHRPSRPEDANPQWWPYDCGLLQPEQFNCSTVRTEDTYLIVATSVPASYESLDFRTWWNGVELAPAARENQNCGRVAADRIRFRTGVNTITYSVQYNGNMCDLYEFRNVVGTCERCSYTWSRSCMIE
jgi:hypothetical protein